MAREIKFRAWDVEHKVMVNGLAIDFRGEILCTKKRGSDGKYAFKKHEGYDRERYILMQYTGLKDKNGKEIYEGDIVQCAVRIEGRLAKQARGEVVYADNVAAFCVRLDDDYGSLRTGPSTDGSWYTLEMTHLSDFIVLGDIYQNPDLLT